MVRLDEYILCTEMQTDGRTDARWTDGQTQALRGAGGRLQKVSSLPTLRPGRGAAPGAGREAPLGRVSSQTFLDQDGRLTLEASGSSVAAERAYGRDRGGRGECA